MFGTSVPSAGSTKYLVYKQFPLFKQAPLMMSVMYRRYNLCSFKIICLRYDYNILIQ